MRILPLTRVCFLAALVNGCFGSHSNDRGADAAALVDAGTDGARACVPSHSAELIAGAPAVMAEPVPGDPYLSVARAIAYREQVAVLFQQTTPSPDGATGRLVKVGLFDAAGGLSSVHTVWRDPAEVDGFLDLVGIAGELVVVGAERRVAGGSEYVEVWIAGMDDDGITEPRTSIGTTDASAFQAMTSVNESGALVMYSAESGALFRHNIDGRAFDVGTNLGSLDLSDVDYRVHISSAASDDLTCLTVLGFPSGSLTLYEISAGAVRSRDRLADRGVFVVPVPEVRSGECAVAWFEPDVARPTRGRARVRSPLGGAIGWGGTTPFGLALLPGQDAVALAVPSNVWPGEVELSVVGLDDAVCTLPPAALRFPTGALSPPLGAVVVAGSGDQPLVFLGSLSGLGTLSAVRLVPTL